MFLKILDRTSRFLFCLMHICTLIPPMNFQSVCLMPEKFFIDLCTEISRLPSYSLNDYSIKPETKSEEGLFDVYLYKDENTPDTHIKRAKARGCHFIPKLFLSDDESKKYSVLVYRPMGNGLELIDQIDNLVTLGYSEPNPVRPTELRHWESVTMMSSENFIKVCEEVLRIPRYSILYSSNSLGLADPEEYEVFHLDENRRPFIDRVRARGPCRTIPRLYLSDGSKKFSAFLHQFVGVKRLLRVDTAENLRNLGYDRQLEGAPTLLQDRHLEPIASMSASKFSLLCDEIIQLPTFAGLYLKDFSVPESNVDAYDVYSLPEGQVHARKCPIEPELVISDGPTLQSIFVYLNGNMGIVKIDQLTRLNSLTSASAASSALLSMPEIEFLNLCDEICELFFFFSAFNMNRDAVSGTCEGAVYLPGENVVFGYVKSRVCPTFPKELHLSDGPTEGSVWIYRGNLRTLVRIYTLENLSNLKSINTEEETISGSSSGSVVRNEVSDI